MSKPVYTIIARFPGRLDWQELNAAIIKELGDDTLCFETENDYRNAIKEGFVEFIGNETRLLSDEI